MRAVRGATGTLVSIIVFVMGDEGTDWNPKFCRLRRPMRWPYSWVETVAASKIIAETTALKIRRSTLQFNCISYLTGQNVNGTPSDFSHSDYRSGEKRTRCKFSLHLSFLYSHFSRGHQAPSRAIGYGDLSAAGRRRFPSCSFYLFEGRPWSLHNLRNKKRETIYFT